MGNANDLERFAEFLDTLMVKLCDAGQDGELGAGSLYVSLLRMLNEQLVVPGLVERKTFGGQCEKPSCLC